MDNDEMTPQEVARFACDRRIATLEARIASAVHKGWKPVEADIRLLQQQRSRVFLDVL